ncbi:tubulin binding cofactor C-domain-containing protein [Lentinula aff. detonsa]|uniref:Tubulin binding cofactor C-domain-containing protein n=1 Tax=Lentinula aff. detonsa TaxID=2804958 RepID=A0AA38ND50_9AGAR|nr:tubulin binding cofactor C-domain-containing protein [Lentinula aff. detonsa]
MADPQTPEGSRWNFSQSFLSDFQSSRSDLQTCIQQATQSGTASKQTLDNLNLQLAQLSKNIVDAAGSIPKFDQRNCENQLKEIEQSLERLRKASSPASKFAFKRKAREATQPPSNVSTASVTGSVAPKSSLTLSSYTMKLVTPRDLPDPETIAPELRSELSIIDLDSCILNLLDTKQYEISALHVRDVKNSILLLPVLEGSIILHDLANCVVVVSCHQFRMHSSQNIDVYLSIQSNPIIEHCSGIRFGPYPSAFTLENDQHVPGLAVQDFSHIKSTPSPHWCMLAEGAWKSSEDWQSILTLDAIDLEPVLQQALPGM